MLISLLIGKRLRGFLHALSEQEVVLLVSGPLLAEFMDVASRPKLRKYFPVALAHELELILTGLGERVDVEPGSPQAISRDPKDDYLLLMARKGKADVLITGDDDLLKLERFGKTRILSPRAFTVEFLK
ncbi:MAG TPA: putative toxin-antitoxin system toxin component, PIN family [Flavobacteriales bacterium]|nr:putative toxin-antitoxin system toxin component, PIN family [Flavobacteriales bacterium]